MARPLDQIQIKPECQQQRDRHLQVRDIGHPRHHFCVNGVQGKQGDADPSQRLRSENPACDQIEEKHHGAMQQQVEQMESVRNRAERLINQQISKAHQGPIVSYGAVPDLECPSRRRKNRTQKMKAAQERILHHLVLIVVHEAVPQRIQIGQNARGGEQRIPERFCPGKLSPQARGRALFGFADACRDRVFTHGSIVERFSATPEFAPALRFSERNTTVPLRSSWFICASIGRKRPPDPTTG